MINYCKNQNVAVNLQRRINETTQYGNEKQSWRTPRERGPPISESGRGTHGAHLPGSF